MNILEILAVIFIFIPVVLLGVGTLFIALYMCWYACIWRVMIKGDTPPSLFRRD